MTEGHRDPCILIVGGGVAARAAALAALQRGAQVHVVTRGEAFEMAAEARITIHEGARLAALSGTAGDFVATIETMAVSEEEETAVSIEVEAGEVILAEVFGATNATSWGEYGYGRWENVLTLDEFERLALSARGAIPAKVAFVQCLERDRMPCCRRAVELARAAMEGVAEAEFVLFAMNAVMPSEAGVLREVRSIPGDVKCVRKTRGLVVRYVTEEGALEEEEFSMVVLVGA